VRAAWINFDNVEISKSPLRFSEKLKMLMSQDTKRKQYFNLLLRHLVQTELRDHQQGPDATIASHVLLVRPHAQRAMSPYPGESLRQVSIDGRRITKWLLAEGHEAGALIALGIRADAVISIATDDEPRLSRRGDFFVPHSIVATLATAYVASHFFRASNVTIGLDLMRDLSIGAEALGGLTGAFFFGFAAMQIPCGFFFDRYGPRRTVVGMLCVAISGSIVFILASNWPILLVGRMLMGAGFGVMLIGSMVVISRCRSIFHCHRYGLIHRPARQFGCHHSIGMGVSSRRLAYRVCGVARFCERCTD
jgi:Major Facilitator Superfamily